MLRVALCLVLFAALAPAARLDEYALILETPPLAETHTARDSAGHRAMRQAQTTLIGELNRRHIPVTGSVQTLLNAVFVLVPRGTSPDLAGLPGVRRAAYLAPLHLQLNKALDLMKVRDAWALPAIGGMDNAGANIKIGIIDTGIDITHPAFQDASLKAPAGFPRGDTHFTNAKVIVARSYVSLLSSTDPAFSTPDDLTPVDRVGHGTAIAMIAAGAQVSAPLATISGVAPKAFLGNYKIYGSPGLNNFTNASAMIQALEDALADGMDVVNLASGDSAVYGPLDTDAACGTNNLRSYIPINACDVRAQAVENAVRSGMVVVTAAGDDGEAGAVYPALGTINSPGTAPSAITVGASTNAHIFYASVRVAGSGVPATLAQIDALFGGRIPAGAITAPLIDVTKTGDDGTACHPAPANSLAGSIALVKRGVCTFAVKAINVQNAGAVAMLLYLDNATDELFTPSDLSDSAIPTVLIRNADGLALQTWLKSQPSLNVTLDPALRETPASFDTVAGFSSRGPSIGAAALIKPELVAVGTDLYTAAPRYDPNGLFWSASLYSSVEGTSFAAAFVAGAVALVKQAHPGLTPAQYKSAVVNTTSNDVLENGTVARIEAVGSGKLNAANAVQIGMTAVPATLSFNGLLESTGIPASLSLGLTNITGAAGNFSVQVQQTDADTAASVTVAPASGTLAAGQTTTLTVTLAGRRPSPGTYEGFLVISGIGSTLYVPYWYIVSDGIAQNVFAVLGGSQIAGAGDTNNLIGVRVVDRSGLGVGGVPVTFSSVSGGGTLGTADAQTDSYGIAAAFANLGITPSDQVFQASAAGLLQNFYFAARNYPAVADKGVVNAASFVPGTGAAPGSYITIAGANLSPVVSVFTTPYLPISLVNTAVTFDTAAISVPGHVSYVSPIQINVQVPWELQGAASANVKVIVDGLASTVQTVPIVTAAPAFFEFTDPGTSKLAAAALDASFALITAAHPVVRGQVAQLFVNGLGPVSNQPGDGQIALADPLSRTTSTPVVQIGNQSAMVQFSGMAPGIVGLYQVNVVVPPNLVPGPQPITIAIAGQMSPASTLSVQ